MTTKFCVLTATLVLGSALHGLSQQDRVHKMQEPQSILESRVRQLVADDEQLTKEIQSLDRRAAQNGADQTEFLSQLKRLEAALSVVKLQLAAVTARQLSYDDAKKVLEARNRVSVANHKATETDKLVVEKAQKNIPAELAKAKADQTAAQSELKRLTATLPPLEAKAAKSRDNADAALIVAAREATSLLDKEVPSDAIKKKPK